MATIEDWQKYINLLHEFALIEDDLRYAARFLGNDYATDVLWEHFGVSV